MPQKSSIASEKPSAFKHWIDGVLLKRMSEALNQAYPSFDVKGFRSLEKELSKLELKERVRLVSRGLRQHLPERFPDAVRVLLESLESETLNGFDLWPYTEFVGVYGLDHFHESMMALRVLTQRFTSEFAVRPFLQRYPDRTLALLLRWADDGSHHVRRWVSEGSRPRLPWGERLDLFIKEPAKTLPLLEALKDDPELYVRKSVANHLNDISKDHPDFVVRVVERWAAEADQESALRIEWIRRHALRTLVKKGHPGALKSLGVKTGVAVRIENLALNKEVFRLNDVIEFSFDLVSSSSQEHKLIVDYVIHHVKSDQTLKPKVFKLKSLTLPPRKSMVISKKHSLRPVTTRKYYSGKHLIEIQVNGRILAKAEWRLRA